MSNFIDRVIYNGDYSDGAYINIDMLVMQLKWHAQGSLSASAIKTFWDMNTGQATQFDAILATRPASPLLLINVPAYVLWVHKVCGILYAAAHAWTGYTTVGDVETALGV